MNENRATELEKIAEEIQNLHQSPLYEYRQTNNYKMVPGEGNPEAAIMFIGEAPGEKEAKNGRPFIGASGRLLSELLESIGLEREDVYITNIVKDRPPDNRDPTAAEIQLYQPFLLRQIEIIQPQVIVTLGRFAMDFILNQFSMAERGQKISQLHGQLLTAQTSYGQISVVPLYHPAVALYTRDSGEVLKHDFQILKQFVQETPKRS
jgi:uracil-DNA glycosylase family 4